VQNLVEQPIERIFDLAATPFVEVFELREQSREFIVLELFGPFL